MQSNTPCRKLSTARHKSKMKAIYTRHKVNTAKNNIFKIRVNAATLFILYDFMFIKIEILKHKT